MAETKKTTETKTVKSSETKAAAPKAATAKKTTTAKTTTAKTTTAKTAAPKAPKAAPAKVAEVKAEPVAEVKAPVTKKAEKKPAAEMLKVTLVKSGSGRLEKQKRTLEALGLRKTNSSNIVPDNAAIRGMIFVVKHLVSVEKVK